MESITLLQIARRERQWKNENPSIWWSCGKNLVASYFLFMMYTVSVSKRPTY